MAFPTDSGKCFAMLVHALRGLEQQSVRFVWDTECQSAFDGVKVTLCSVPDPDQRLEVICDASGFGRVLCCCKGCDP